MANKRYEKGRLILKTSEEPFARGSRSADFNRIDILGEIGVIGSYQVQELGVNSFPQAAFIYGECECPILEDPSEDAVRNDRAKLVETERTKALLEWIRLQVEELSASIAEVEREKDNREKKKVSTETNEFLNRWKDQFMTKVMGEMFDPGPGGKGDPDKPVKPRVLAAPENGLEFSYPAAEVVIGETKRITIKASSPDPIPLGSVIIFDSSESAVDLPKSRITIENKDLKTTEQGESVAIPNIEVTGVKAGKKAKITAEVGPYADDIEITVVKEKEGTAKKKPRTPRILLSGSDPDPIGLAPQGSVILIERDPVVYQRLQDVDEGIYWINTASPLAKVILDNFSAESVRWRDFLFQRYVDIFVKQGLYELERKDPENFRPALVDSEIMGSLVQKVHAAAVNDLGSFFLDEEFNPKAE